jgi:hypothetical protein
MANALTKLAQQVAQQQVAANRAPLPTSLRSSGSPETSGEGGVDADALLLNPLKPGIFRALWQTPVNAVRSQIVSQKSSATPANSTEQGAAASGLLNNPTTALATLSAVPDMSVSLGCNSNVLVNFQGSFQGPSSATATFALYRDGTQIGRELFLSPPVTGAPFLVSIAATDAPPDGTHAYSAQWATSAGTLTAAAYARTIQAVNQRPA